MSPYYEHLMGNSSYHFYDVICIVEKIKYGIKSGRINKTVEKKRFCREEKGE